MKSAIPFLVAFLLGGCNKSTPIKTVSSSWKPIAWQYSYQDHPCVTLENAGRKDGDINYGYFFEVMSKPEDGATEIFDEKVFTATSDDAALEFADTLLKSAEAECVKEPEHLVINSITQSSTASGSSNIVSTGNNNSITINGKKVK